jgi:hypothetical protein
VLRREKDLVGKARWDNCKSCLERKKERKKENAFGVK